jgi:hypothetical protein
MLTEQNIEAELSYAYLHAVASRAGFSCEYTPRHADAAGSMPLELFHGKIRIDLSPILTISYANHAVSG